MTDCDKCEVPECDQRGAYPVCPRRETQDMSRRNCQDHGFIEDYKEYDLVPLDPTERKETYAVAIVAAVILIGGTIAGLLL